MANAVSLALLVLTASLDHRAQLDHQAIATRLLACPVECHPCRHQRVMALEIRYEFHPQIDSLRNTYFLISIEGPGGIKGPDEEGGTRPETNGAGGGSEEGFRPPPIEALHFRR